MKNTAPIKPDDYILSVISPEDRLEAAFKIAQEAFKKKKLKIKDIEKSIEKVRSKAYEKA